ncbi:MAG: hypothetical protein IJW20_02190 [Clostridia bacterium]|nr:hypothetical protein [Clostridia bacterium]
MFKRKKNKIADDIINKERNMVISLEQRQVYSEVLEVLRHMDKLYVDKIPKKLIMFFYDNCSLDYEFTMTKSIGEEKLNDKTLALLSLLHANYWSAKKKTKEELIMDYAVIDQRTQKQLNSQLEQENIFTRIDVSSNNSSSDENGNLPVPVNSALNIVKKILNLIKTAFIKFFGD